MLNVSNLLSTDGIDISKCILCQKSKREYLSKGAKGKANLLNAARILHDDERSEDFKYHATSCYSTYIKALKRNNQEPTLQQSCSTNPDTDISPENTRSERQKVDTKNVCVVCGHDRTWDKTLEMRIHKLFRLRELSPAQKLLNASELNRDDVYTRIVFCYEGGAKDKYARDIHYHANCLRKYFREYDRRIDSIMVNLEKEEDTSNDIISNVFEEIMSSFDLDNNTYSVSF